ncbi:hypothetical protein C0991_007385 [Blastosporella zonata]|nr:hypothetical protein C0991_007385 [Blastosporella zonata]
MNFYFEAAKTLNRLDSKQGSIKGVLATLPEKDRKRTAALVIETLKYKVVLTDIINQAKLLKEERKITSLNLALVLVHDLLLSGGIQAGDGPIKQAVLRHKTRLNGELQKIKIKRGAKANADLAQTGDQRAARIPRYVRVNTLAWSTDEAVKSLISRGFTVSDPFESDFSPRIAFHEDPFYKAGKIILQDKASCFPAAVLAPPATDNSCVIDATSAPGNKTSHLSALMKNKGKLFAFERDKKRCMPSIALISDLGTELYLEIEEEGNQEGRLKRLAGFQVMMVKHAMRFPGVQKIVYSTCSIHATENEHVVLESLNSDEAKAGSFGLASPKEVLPQWPRRGLPEEMEDPSQAESLVRCSPGEDATNGFFVSCFVRDQPSFQKRKLDVVESEIGQEACHKKKGKHKAVPS